MMDILRQLILEVQHAPRPSVFRHPHIPTRPRQTRPAGPTLPTVLRSRRDAVHTSPRRIPLAYGPLQPNSPGPSAPAPRVPPPPPSDSLAGTARPRRVIGPDLHPPAPTPW